MDNVWRPSQTSSGVFERYFNGDGASFHREKVQDVSSIINNNTRIRNETDGVTKGGGRLVGSIPVVIYHEWVAEWTKKGLIGPGNMSGLNDLLVARLRDSDYSKLKTTSGSI